MYAQRTLTPDEAAIRAIAQKHEALESAVRDIHDRHTAILKENAELRNQRAKILEEVAELRGLVISGAITAEHGPSVLIRYLREHQAEVVSMIRPMVRELFRPILSEFIGGTNGQR